MGYSTFFGLELGKRALFAQQTALSTTGHNIANANTPGYSRQRADMETTKPLFNPGMNMGTYPMQVGSGVEVSQITRMRDDFLDTQYREENDGLGYWKSQSDTLSKIEDIFNEPSDNGLQNVMDQFWQGWKDLVDNAESPPARAVVQERANAVAETFHYISTSFDQTRADLDNQLTTKVKEANSIAGQIKDLNEQITRLVPHGYQPNDLLDKRDQLLDQLSGLMNIDVMPSTAGPGMVDVRVNGHSLVSGTGAENIDLVFDPVTHDPKLTVNGKGFAPSSGEIAGILDSRLTILPKLVGQVDLLAGQFAKTLNEVHTKGYDLNGNPGENFFVNETDLSGEGITAANIKLNPLIAASVNKIAAGQTTNDGDGSNAQAIASLRFDHTISFGEETSSAADYYRNIIAGLGVASQNAQRMAGNSEILVNQVDNRRQSVSGVSLDEEMTNMVKFQQAYNAAARYVTTVDELLDKVINGMGRVGL